MFIKKIKYVDFEGTEREDERCFHLSKAELLEMELGIKGGLTNHINRIIADNDSPEIVKFFKELILKSVGVKDPEGKRFIKNSEIRESFEQSEAYSELFIELATNPDSAKAFVQGIMPAGLNLEDHEKLISIAESKKVN